MKPYYPLSIRLFGYLVICLSFSCEGAGSDTTETNKVEEINTQISFTTSDSVMVTGDLVDLSPEAPTVLLFHQGGSNSRGEYGPIIPNLLSEGFNVLSIDQRQGGQLYGSYNRTVAQFELNDFGYCDAYPDLEGALDYLIEKGFSGKKILWGSSYSAALVVKLAHERTADISAVLAFSPASGGPMAACAPNGYFESLEVPLLVLRPGNEAKLESVQQQLALAEQHGHQTYVAEQGVHGSSMLVTGRAEGGEGESWEVVMNFLNKNK